MYSLLVRCSIRYGRMALSNSLEMLERREIGLNPCTDDLSSPLGMGLTYAIFHDEGNTPVLNDKLKQRRSTGAKLSAVFFKAVFEIWSGPGAFPSGRCFIIGRRLLSWSWTELMVELGKG